MQRTLRSKAVPQLPAVPWQVVGPVVTVGAFGWLLLNDAIQPLAVFLLQLFLSF